MQNSSLGATYLGEGKTGFCVWSPTTQLVEVHFLAPDDRNVALTRDRLGYHRGIVHDTSPGHLYFCRLDSGTERPDPASRCQPLGVHGPSQVCDPFFPWEDVSWTGLRLADYILYELHVGTFTGEGTFEAIIPHLDYLCDLGITAVELMPVAQFPGGRNWGYDGVYPYAVQDSYGGRQGLKKLINACHSRSLAVALDVVYNHLGPEGNYLWDFGPYFTDKYRTPWGSAINFDGPYSDDVRRFFVENALYWVTEFHIDALRIDAVHGIFDFSARHFLEDLARAVHERAEGLNRRIYVIPESDLNDARLIRSRDLGGYGLDAQWNDDFHHALHTLLTRERRGYYQDFGELSHLAKAFREGFVYSGQYSRFRKRCHGNSSTDIPASRFVVCSQNHDQIGNRAASNRLTDLVTMEELKLAAGVVLLSPFIPLLFMGEEYAETAPFPYFVSHADLDLVEAVRRGRTEEFSDFMWEGETRDPQDEATFLSAKLDHALKDKGHHRVMLDFYRTLIALRKEFSALSPIHSRDREVIDWQPSNLLVVRCRGPWEEIAILFHFGEAAVSVVAPLPEGKWQKRLDSAETRWNGPGSAITVSLVSSGEISLELNPLSVLLFVQPKESRSTTIPG